MASSPSHRGLDLQLLVDHLLIMMNIGQAFINTNINICGDKRLTTAVMYFAAWWSSAYHHNIANSHLQALRKPYEFLVIKICMEVEAEVLTALELQQLQVICNEVFRDGARAAMYRGALLRWRTRHYADEIGLG